MYGVKVGYVWITHIKDHEPQWIGAAAVVARHFHVRWHYHRLTSFHRDWIAPLHLQRECAFQDINSHREAVYMKHSLIVRFEARRKNTHFLLFALG